MSKFDQIKNLFGQETQINIHKVYASMQILMEKFQDIATWNVCHWPKSGWSLNHIHTQGLGL